MSAEGHALRDAELACELLEGSAPRPVADDRGGRLGPELGDVLERAVSVPDMGGGSILVTERERPVVTRAGVSGSAR